MFHILLSQIDYAIFDDSTTNFASASNTSNVSLLRNLRMKNPKDKIFSYININSIPNNFENHCDLISKNVDILSVTETKLDPSLFLIRNFSYLVVMSP